MSDVYHRGTESQRETFNFPDAGRLERKPFNPTRVVTGREPRSQDKILSVASGSIPKPTRTDLARYVQRRTVSAVSGRFPPCLGASVVNLTHECPESGLVVAPREARDVSLLRAMEGEAPTSRLSEEFCMRHKRARSRSIFHHGGTESRKENITPPPMRAVLNGCRSIHPAC